MKAAHRLLAAKDQARHERVVADVSGQLLVHAHAPLDDAAAMQIRAGQNVARAASMSAITLAIE